MARWTPAGITGLDGLPPTDRYHHLAFGPDGQALWASPSRDDPNWALSDIVDLASGIIWAGQRWDTESRCTRAAIWWPRLPARQAQRTWSSPGLSRAGHPPQMRLLRRALILDADGYMTPVFSPDGRHLAVRGSSYGHFPARRALDRDTGRDLHRD